MCANLYGCQRFVIVLRSPSNRIPFAVRSDCVRRPIGFRPPSGWIPSAVQSDSVRRPMVSVELLLCANSVEKCRYVT